MKRHVMDENKIKNDMEKIDTNSWRSMQEEKSTFPN